jgi:hypothetical protein
VAVGVLAVSILPANPARVSAVVQNTGTANIRVGVAGVTATTGIRVLPNGTVTYQNPNCPPGELFAIREGGVDSIAFVVEETT